MQNVIDDDELTMSRIDVLTNKKANHITEKRREIGQLLANGKNHIASLKVECVINDRKTCEAHEFIKVYCERIVPRLEMMKIERDCPGDLKEAVAGLIFASKKCSDLTELKNFRKHLSVKYRNDFTEAKKGIGVDLQILRRLSAGKPDMREKIEVLTSIAEEHNITWNPRSLEEQPKQQPEVNRMEKESPSSSHNSLPDDSEQEQRHNYHRIEVHGCCSCCNGCFSFGATSNRCC